MALQQRKKIIYIFGTLRIGGTERQIVETAISLNRERFEPKLFCLSGGGPLQALADRHGIAVTIGNTISNGSSRTHLFPLTWLKKLLILSRYLRQEHPDIIHCYLFTPSIYGGIASRFAGKPVFLSSRRCLGLFKDDLHVRYQTLENLINRFSDRILVNSEAVKQAVLQREQIDVQKIHVIHNGVNIQKYRPIEDRPDLRSYLKQKRYEFGIPEHASVIGMVANLIPYKGYDDFLMAAAVVRQQYPDTRFLCIGEDRGMQNDLEALRRNLGLGTHVMFTGSVQTIPEILHLLDIQVSASHQEGFSNAILEGMASGKPVIATAVGGTPEAVDDHVTGLLVPPKDPDALAQAIISLLAHPEWAGQLGHNGRKRVERHFSFEKMIDKLEKLYLQSYP